MHSTYILPCPGCSQVTRDHHVFFNNHHNNIIITVIIMICRLSTGVNVSSWTTSKCRTCHATGRSFSPSLAVCFDTGRRGTLPTLRSHADPAGLNYNTPSFFTCICIIVS